MKKILLILMLLLLSACQSKPLEETDLKILAPTGSPSIALIPELLKEDHQVELVFGPDALQAALINEDSEYDVIIAPINLGAQLFNNGKTQYKLHSIVTWGNLFLVSKPNQFESMAGFGELAVPGLIFNQTKDLIDTPDDITWVPSVADAQALLLSGKVDGALLAEPALSATLMKANAENIDLEVLFDLSELYQQKFNVDGFPQAALFVKEDVKVASLVKRMSDYLSNQDSLETDLETIDTETMGLPQPKIVKQAFDAMAINVQPAHEKINEIKQFLELMNIEFNEELIIK